MTPRQSRSMPGLLQTFGILLIVPLLLILVPAGISHASSRTSARMTVTGLPTLFIADVDDDHNRESLYGIDATIGTTRWDITLTPSFQPQTPFAGFFGGSGKVYLSDGNASAYNAENGTQVWTQSRPPVTSTTSVGFNNMILAGGFDHTFTARNAVTGGLVWQTSLSVSPTRGVVATVGGISRVYFGSSCCTDDVTALDAATGAQLWQIHLASSNAGTTAPAFDASSGYVYIASSDEQLYALDPRSGGIVWTFFAGSDISAAPRVINGMVYVGTFSGTFYALDASTGHQVWSFDNNKIMSVEATPIVANNLVYFSDATGTVYAHNATHAGPLVWTFHPTFTGISFTGLTIANGLLYEAVDSRPPAPQSDVVSVYAIDATNGHYQWRWDGFPHGRLLGDAAPPVLVV